MTDKVLGHATAYGYYKAGGGTMTEAEFTEFMADFGTASQTAVEAAQAALASKNAAQTAATTATNKATEATTAATTATTKAGEASTSASTATSAKDTAVSASQTATTKATEATTAAATATSAKTDAVAANTAAQSAKTAAQTAQTGAETAAASVQSSAAQIQTNADDISELKEELTAVESNILNPYCGSAYSTTSSKYYRVLGTPLATGSYILKITVATAGSHEFKIGTNGNSSAMVDTIGTYSMTAGQTILIHGYTPSTSGLSYVRNSNNDEWNIDVYTSSSLWDAISDLQNGASLSYEIVKTSQLFNKNETPGYFYIKSDGEIIENQNIARSWVIELESSKRYVSYVTQTLEGSDNFEIALFDEMPAVGVIATRTKVTAQHTKGTAEFTTSASEKYALVKFGGDFANISTDVARYGLEQIDSGTKYKNETYGYKSIILGEVASDNISVEEARNILDKAGYANKWNGKTIWWCGTSIPYGKDQALGSAGNGLAYPEMVGELLGATVYNEALGSSMARANVRTGDYVNAMSYNLLLSLSQTLEEKQYIINNWSTVRQSLIDPNTFETLTNEMQTSAINASFEKRLLPYLDGTYDMPDLFVFDHGHNDWKTFYTLPDTITPDTELQPTVANITNNILAEDTYMTANSNAKLISFFGEIANIPSAKRPEFIASVNRNCFIGAINFLCTLILSYNPRARIAFIGNLDNWAKPQVQPAQEAVASSWNFPLIKTWNYLGFSNHYVPNSATFWDDEGTTDLIVKDIYCKDAVHPHSDTTGIALQLYAHAIANVLRTFV